MGQPPSSSCRLLVSTMGGFSQGVLLFAPIPFILVVERDLGLNAAQIALWVNLHLTATVLLSIPIGWAIDHWGMRWVGRFGLLVMTLGAFGRSQTGSYESLIAFSVLLSAGLVAFFICVPKALSMWFPAQRLGFATGLFIGSLGSGAALALALSRPLFGSAWNNAFLAAAFSALVSTLLWWLGVGDKNEGQQQSASLATIRSVLMARPTWILTGIFFLYLSAFTTWSTYGFPFLVRFRNITEVTAGVTLTVTMVGYTLAAIIVPALSDRFGKRRRFLLAFSALAALMFTAVQVSQSEPVLLVVAFLLGVSFGSINPLIFILAAEDPKLGPAAMGASVGVISSVGSLAGFSVPIALGHALGSLQSATQEMFQVVWLLAIVWVVALFGLSLQLPAVRKAG